MWNPFALVPHHDGPAAILSLGNGPFEAGVFPGVIFNLNNGALVLGTTGSGDGASICGLSGTDPCVTSAAGAPYPALCTDLSAGNLHAGKLVAAFTALDLPSPVFDVLATVGITCD